MHYSPAPGVVTFSTSDPSSVNTWVLLCEEAMDSGKPPGMDHDGFSDGRVNVAT